MLSALLASAAAFASAALPAQPPTFQWSQYLGPTRDGVAADFAWPAQPKLVEAWRKPFASGVSSIIVAGGRAFTMGTDGEHDYLFAFDPATGRDLWRARIGPTHADAQSGPAATPAAAGELIIAVGSSCVVQAVNAATGSLAWSKDLAQAYKTRFAARGGCGMSPLVVGSLVILPTGAPDTDRLVAVEAASGSQVWTTAGPARSINTSPGLLPNPSAGQVLYHYAKPPGLSGVSGVNARDGAVQWELDAENGMSNQSPVALPGNRVLLQTWANTSMLAVPAPGVTQPARRLWTTGEITAGAAPAVYRDGYLYGFGGNSGEFFKCMDANTGEVKWSTRLYRGASVLVGRTLVVLSESSGLLRLVDAVPDAYRETGRLQVLKPGASTQTPPSFALGLVFFRNLDEIGAVAIK
jgi:outer membrane protein assembly factor BamB